MNYLKIIEVLNLSKIYGKGDNQVSALDNVSFDICKGEFVAILGKSGCGKSTLLHLLAGLDKPSDGSVFINNKNIFKMKKEELTQFRRKNIGVVYQFFNLIPALNVYENIALPALFDGKNISSLNIDGLLQNLDILKYKKFFPNDLSGGCQQRVAIGRALINKPKILFCDEPTGNLDSKTGRQIMKLLEFYNKKYKQTIVMVTHDEVLAKRTSRIITMSDGRVVSDVKNCYTNFKRK